MPLSPGEILGRYEILAPIGAGPQSVYQARERGLGHMVALHILPAGSLTRALRATASLHHPNIGTVYETGSEPDFDYVVSELPEGTPLEDLIQPKALDIRDVLRYGAEAAAALAVAHAAGIPHGDVSLRNLWVRPGGSLEVRGFAMPGGALPAGESQDIVALGGVLYRLATGRSPNGADPPPMRELPPEASRVIGRCLRRDPARRFQNMADLKVALEELADDAASGRLLAPDSRPFRSAWYWVAPFAAALGIVAGWKLFLPAPQTEPGLQAFPLTGYSGEEYAPSFSPDGSQVAFTWNGERGDNFDIYIKPVGPGLPTRLTTNTALDRSGKWSPDGRTIAFLRDREGARTDVIVIPAAGGAERRLAEFYRNPGYFAGGLDWTPDSKSILVAGARAPDQPRALFRIAVETGGTRQVTNPPAHTEGDVTPAVSPDGHTLAFLRASSAGQEILLLQLGSRFEAVGQPARVNLAGYVPSSVAWMPDGRELIFSSGEGLLSQLYRVPAGGAAVRPLPLAGMGALSPTIARSGHRLAYVLMVQDTNIWRTALNDRSVPEKLLASSFREVFPQFSPDGQRIAFHSNQSGEIQIWTSDPQGSSPLQLTNLHGAIARNARWSPDGKQLVFESNASGHWQIYTIGSRGAQTRRFTNDPFDNVTPSWSRDGRWIYYSSRRQGKMEIWKAPADGGDAVPVTHTGGEAPLESPDGRRLFYVKDEGRGGLWWMPPAGGAETQVFPSIYRFNYAVGENGVYFTSAPDESGGSSIQVLDLATGEVAELAKIEKPLDLGLALSPDGRYILHAQVDYHGVDLMMADGFR